MTMTMKKFYCHALHKEYSIHSHSHLSLLLHLKIQYIRESYMAKGARSHGLCELLWKMTAPWNWWRFHPWFRQWLIASSVATLKRKCLHFDEIFITGCTGSCQNDNFQCSQWLKFRQNDDIFVSVKLLPEPIMTYYKSDPLGDISATFGWNTTVTCQHNAFAIAVLYFIGPCYIETLRHRVQHEHVHGQMGVASQHDIRWYMCHGRHCAICWHEARTFKQATRWSADIGSSYPVYLAPDVWGPFQYPITCLIDLEKSRNRESFVLDYHIAMKFGSSTAEQRC